MHQTTLVSVHCTTLSNITTFEQRTVPSSQQQKQKPMKMVPLLRKCKVTADTHKHCNYAALHRPSEELFQKEFVGLNDIYIAY